MNLQIRTRLYPKKVRKRHQIVALTVSIENESIVVRFVARRASVAAYKLLLPSDEKLNGRQPQDHDIKKYAPSGDNDKFRPFRNPFWRLNVAKGRSFR